MAVFALKGQLCRVPDMLLTATMLADNTGLFPLFLQISYTRGFIGKPLHEIQDIHNVFLLLYYKYTKCQQNTKIYVGVNSSALC